MATLIQSTKGRLKPLKGIIIIVVSVAALFMLDGALVYLNRRGAISDTAANIVIGAFALILFITLLVRFSISCMYTLDGVKITFSRVYIKNPRLEEQVMLREVVFFGSAQEGESRYDCVRTRRFGARDKKTETKALIYKSDKKLKRILFCPNDEISSALTEALKALKTKK